MTQSTTSNNYFEGLSLSEKIVSDYPTSEAILKFKKHKKKMSLRKKDKLDLDALEAEVDSACLGVRDLGSRNNSNWQAIRDKRDRLETEMRGNAYQAAYAKADEAAKALIVVQPQNVRVEEVKNPILGDDDEDLFTSLKRARKVAALKKQDTAAFTGPEAIARLASLTAGDQTVTSRNNVVYTDVEEFLGGLHSMVKDLAPNSLDQEMKDDYGRRIEPRGKHSEKEEPCSVVNEQGNIVPDGTFHEAPIGKGLSGALKRLKDCGSFKKTVECGGRNTDMKKSKRVGVVEHGDRHKEIQLERTDEFGRILTKEEDYRLMSHVFHGKFPGKKKQEKRRRQHEQEMKVKRINTSDTPSKSVEDMRLLQAHWKTPYLVLSGHIK